MIRRELFVDASAWIALASIRDQHHRQAVATYPELTNGYRKLVTTNLVIAEVHAFVRRRSGFSPAIEFLELVRSSPKVERVWSSPEWEEAAEAILRQYADQDFSYTDAVSFAVMRHRGIAEAFTFDQHFAAAGFGVMPEGMTSS